MAKICSAPSVHAQVLEPGDTLRAGTMRGSFVRKGAGGGKAAPDPGTRPGLHGQTLISMGLVDLDRLMGGGLPLGTVTLIIEDHHSGQHLNLLRYFLGEGLATGQRTLWLTARPPAGGAHAFLPALATKTSSTTTDSPTTSSQQGAAAGESGDQGLRIAWQYRKYIQEGGAAAAGAGASTTSSSGASSSTRPSSTSGSSGSSSSSTSAAQKALDAGIGREWCHTFDLTRNCTQQEVEASRLVLRPCQGASSLEDAAQGAVEFAGSFLPPAPPPGVPPSVVPVRGGPETVGRLVVQSLCSPLWSTSSNAGSNTSSSERDTGGRDGESESDESAWRAAALLLYRLRMAVQDTRCAAVVTCEADTLPPSWRLRLQHLCDIVLALDTISDDSDIYKLLPDASSAAALLSIPRPPGVGMLAPRAPDTQLYVVRHKRKRLAVTPVEVDPDAEAKQQEAVAAAAAALVSGLTIGAGGGLNGSKASSKSAAGAGVPKGGGHKDLDF